MAVNNIKIFKIIKLAFTIKSGDFKRLINKVRYVDLNKCPINLFVSINCALSQFHIRHQRHDHQTLKIKVNRLFAFVYENMKQQNN